MLRDDLDVCSGSSNKAVAAIPGVSFVVAKRESVPALKKITRRNIYLNLQEHIRIADESSQTPNTPSVTIFIALNEALKELQEEGLENRLSRYRQCSQYIRQGVKDLQLKTLLPDQVCSNTVTSVFLPEGIQLDEFIDALDRRGYIVYPGKRQLYEQGLFQIANMGQIHLQDCVQFLQVLRETLDYLGADKIPDEQL